MQVIAFQLHTHQNIAINHRFSQECKMKQRLLFSIVFVTLLAIGSLDLLQASPIRKKLVKRGKLTSIEIADTIFGVLGAGDITVDPRTGMAFIACDYRRKQEEDYVFPGAIYGLDLSSEKPYLRHLTPDLAFEFHPQGISFYSDPQTGQDRLFVINRKRKQPTIEIFKWENKKLIHIETLAHPALVSPNDIQATGLRSFYFTNDHGSRTPLGIYLEDLLRIPRANVVYFDGKTFRAVAGKLLYANGIQLNFSNNQLYVSSTLRGRVYQYARDPITGALLLEKYYKVSKGIDNLELDSRGDLWVCANTNLVKYVRHAYVEEAKSPWKLYRIRLSMAREIDPHKIVEEVYRSNGKEISAVSVAAFYKQHILLGSFYQDYIINAKIIEPYSQSSFLFLEY
ncbi:MAG: SMP-30/gluconolactonase/LRE family protein [Bacteroidia bacterium]|nr:SMP-30/gluconolactonase/LRE family protein [Bacteroidia bacterium]MDW8158137.1 SMP-30/gluconolactonase/LRE family protein [Bacteroidia bacterium]